MSVISKAGSRVQNMPGVPLKLAPLEQILKEAGVPPLPGEKVRQKRPNNIPLLVCFWAALIVLAIFIYGWIFMGNAQVSIWGIGMCIIIASIAGTLVDKRQPQVDDPDAMNTYARLPFRWGRLMRQISSAAHARGTRVVFKAERWPNGQLFLLACWPELDTCHYVAEGIENI